MLLYATSDTSAIVGAFKTKNIIEAPINTLITNTIEDTPHQSSDINSYFEGNNKGSAIQVHSYVKFEKVIKIKELKILMKISQSHKILDIFDQKKIPK